MSSSIGIKIANGEFYPILMENKPAKKRMVLTTAHDGQKSVQIDLYRSAEKMMSDAQYIGSLVIEKLKTKKQGEPSVELILSQDAVGEISAEAKDLNNPHSRENARLTISLTSLDRSEMDFSDVRLDSEMDAVADLQVKSGMGHLDAQQMKLKHSPFVPVFIITGILILLAAGFFAWRFFFPDYLQLPRLPFLGIQPKTSVVEEPEPTVPPLPPQEEVVLDEEVIIPSEELEIPIAVPEPLPPPVISAPPVVETPPPPSRERIVAPVLSYKVPSAIPAEGVEYKIRYGDTLWDISQAFYRNPWRYKFLARYNGITNANHIVSGLIIKIPRIP